MIRPAETSDYEAIIAIRNELELDISRLDDDEYVAVMEQRGFLVPVDIPYTEFVEHIPNYIVSEVHGKVSGFLRLDDTQEMAPNEVPHWVDPRVEKTYWNTPHAGIGKIAVSPSMSRRGIGKALLAEAERRAKEEGIPYIFSFIVTCTPPTNHASINFHIRNGFSIVAPLETQEAYGISDYLATLFGKKLS